MSQRASTVVDLILTQDKLNLLETSPDTEPFDGDARMFRLGIEAMRLGLAFEYDPYFSLSIAKVDPLPHQLEAVYDYFTAKRLKKDYYLYIVLHCASTPSLNIFQDPATLDWQPIVKVEHYRLKQDSIRHPVELKEDSVPYKTGGSE